LTETLKIEFYYYSNTELIFKYLISVYKNCTRLLSRRRGALKRYTELMLLLDDVIASLARS